MGALGYLTMVRWQALGRAGLINRRLDRTVAPLVDHWDEGLGCPTGVLDLSPADVDRLVATRACVEYRSRTVPHSKPLEYLTSLTLARVGPGDAVLDAAGGADAQFLHAAREYLPFPISAWSQDGRLEGAERDGIRFVGGSVRSIAVEDASFDVITCHHSIEHFREDIDSAFVREVCRLLRPGGRAVISPLFLADTYAEIWNGAPTDRFDPDATQIVDRSAAFAGWGPWEGFARTYSVSAFNRRVLAHIADDVTASVHEVRLESRPVPDLAHNRHAPKVQAAMKALLLERRAPS